MYNKANINEVRKTIHTRNASYCGKWDKDSLFHKKNIKNNIHHTSTVDENMILGTEVQHHNVDTPRFHIRIPVAMLTSLTIKLMTKRATKTQLGKYGIIKQEQ